MTDPSSVYPTTARTIASKLSHQKQSVDTRQVEKWQRSWIVCIVVILVIMLGAQGEHPSRRRSLSANSKHVRNRGAKRFRPQDIAPVQNGVITASKTPTVDAGRLVDIQVQAVEDLSLFFDDVEVLSEIPPYEVATFVKRALKNNWASEEALRNAVYTNLLENHEIVFPKSSTKEDSPVKKVLRFTSLNRSKKYQEADLASLMTEYGKLRHFEVHNMRRIMRGLPVTTTSKPDLAPLDFRESTVQIRFGEFKNDSQYNENAANTQCVMYLLGLLYWLRAEVGEPVEAVYGFSFCGCRCEDFKNSYSHGKRWSTGNLGRLSPTRRIPALFTLPTNLWEDDDGGERRLVLNSRLSIIFHVSAQGLTSVLEHARHFRSVKYDRGWNVFVSDVNDFLKNNDNASASYYLKIRSKDTCLQNDPMRGMLDVWDLFMTQSVGDEEHQVAHNSISTTYPLMPFGYRNFGVALMRDRGRPLKDLSDLQFDTRNILVEFKKIIYTAMYLSKHLPHGDVLPHNLVYDEAKGHLTLIDIDEGVAMHNDLFTRKNEYSSDGNEDWYIALSYPNFLRTNSQKYTQSQLLASFLYLVGRVPDIDISAEISQKLEKLQDEARRLGEALCEMDKNNELKRTKKNIELIDPELDSAYYAMIDIVNGC